MLLETPQLIEHVILISQIFRYRIILVVSQIGNILPKFYLILLTIDYL